MKKILIAVIILLFAIPAYGQVELARMSPAMVGGSVPVAPAGDEITEDCTAVTDWTNISGTISAANPAGKCSSTAWGQMKARHNTELSSPNHYVEATVEWTAGSSDSVGLIARCDGTNYYVFYMMGDYVELDDNDANMRGQYDGNYTTGTYTLRLEVNGTSAGSVNVKGYVNGDLRINYTTGTITSGSYIGMRADNNTVASGMYADDITGGAL